MGRLLLVFIASLIFSPSACAQLNLDVIAAARNRNVFIRACKMRRRILLPFLTYCEAHYASGVALRFGNILTACHAASGYRNITVGGKRASVIACDKKPDLALLHVADFDDKTVPPLIFGQSVRGDWVIVFSNPETIRNKITYGQIVDVGREIDLKDFNYKRLRLMSDALVLPGSSGGAVYDTAGRLVGIITNLVGDGEYSIFTSVEDVKFFLENSGVDISSPK